MITQQDKIDFYNVLYFSNEYKSYIQKAIWRAYRDFSRTLRFNELKENSEMISTIKDLWENELNITISEVCKFTFSNQQDFDVWHEEKTTSLTKISINQFELSIGQSQKWINMSLKYLFLFGDTIIQNISKNHHFFHIPVDNIIQERFFNTQNIKKIEGSWSRIKDYNQYLDYQKIIRSKSECAFEFEFKLFNDENYNL